MMLLSTNVNSIHEFHTIKLFKATHTSEAERILMLAPLFTCSDKIEFTKYIHPNLLNKSVTRKCSEDDETFV